MKRFIAALLLLPALALSQSVSKQFTIKWSLPTTTKDGLSLTGTNALTSMQLFLSTAPISDASTMLPTATLSASAVTTLQTMSVLNGATLYVRLKACNSTGCGDFGPQGSKLITLDTTPGVPTNVTIEITISP